MSRENQDDGNNIFVKDGRPMRFFFHSSVKEGIDRITANIRRHGGEVVQADRHTDVVLVDEEADIGLISRRYWSNPDRHKLKIEVEPRGFVKQCVRNGVCVHRKPAMQGMPGRPGRKRAGTGVRVNFTAEDDENLVHYMATVFPDTESGGRMGNKYYQELERLAEFPEFEWAARHTWHSWRERYKNNRVMFDERITHIAAELKPFRSERGDDTRSRQHKALRNRRIEEEDEDEDEAVDVEVVEEVKEVEEEEEESEEERVAEEIWEPPLHEYQNAQRDKSNVSKPPSKTHDTSRKQKRSHGSATLHSHSPSSPTHAKRARTSRQQERETSAEMEADIQDDDLFGDYAFGMQDAEERSSPRPLSPPVLIIDSDDGPEMTQRTLVGTSPLMSRPSHDKGHTDGSRRRDMVEGPSSPGETARAVREAVPSTTISSAPANDVAATAARADQASKRGKSRRERPDTERGVSSRPHHGEDAPFRNTRARSRSVEPPPVTKVSTRDIARDNGRKPSRKGSEKWRERGELNGIPEGEDQDDVNEGTQPVPSLESDVQPDPELAPRPGQASTSKRVIRETHEDERVVEVLLEDGASECSGVSSGLFSEGDDENVLPPFHDIEVDMEKSLDEDDQETDQALREAAMVQGVRRSEERRQGDVGVEERSSVLEEGEDTVKELHAKMSSTRLARAPRPIIRMQTRSGVIGTRNAQEPTARARSRHG